MEFVTPYSELYTFSIFVKCTHAYYLCSSARERWGENCGGVGGWCNFEGQSKE